MFIVHQNQKHLKELNKRSFPKTCVQATALKWRGTDCIYCDKISRGFVWKRTFPAALYLALDEDLKLIISNISSKS